MKTLSRTLLLFCLGMALIGAPRIGAGLTLLSNFDSQFLDPNKFYGVDSGGTPAAPIEDLVRGTHDSPSGVGRLLRLGLVSYGDTSSNSGQTLHSQGLNVQEPAGITALQTQVTIQGAIVQSCPANTTFPSLARARLEGALFNSETSSPAPNDATGDVRAIFEKVLDSGTGPVPVQTRFIQAFLILCQNSDCTQNETLPGTAPVIFTKKWSFDVPQKLLWVWDSGAATVTFTLRPGTLHPEIHAIVYSQTDMGAPGRDEKGLRVNNREASCTAGRKGSFIEATFDNLFTGP